MKLIRFTFIGVALLGAFQPLAATTLYITSGTITEYETGYATNFNMAGPGITLNGIDNYGFLGAADSCYVFCPPSTLPVGFGGGINKVFMYGGGTLDQGSGPTAFTLVVPTTIPNTPYSTWKVSGSIPFTSAGHFIGGSFNLNAQICTNPTPTPIVYFPVTCEWSGNVVGSGVVEYTVREVTSFADPLMPPQFQLTGPIIYTFTPEPSTGLLMLVPLAAIWAKKRRQRNRGEAITYT